MLCLAKEQAYEGSFIIADGEALTAAQILRYIAEVLRARPPLHVPEATLPFFSHMPIIGKKLSLYLRERVYDISRLKERLDYTPAASVYDGLREAALGYAKEG